jgi:uncharacterized membrane protein
MTPRPTRRAVGGALLALPVLAVAAYAARFVVHGHHAWPPALAPSFEARPGAIFLHALGGSVVLVAGLVQMNGTIRRRLPRVHVGVGWMYATAAALAGGAGVYMAAYSAGGPVAQLGFGLLGVAVLGATARAVERAIARDVAAHRRWMIRSFALFLAAVTLRVELPLLAATLGTATAYQLVSWLCWVPNVAAAEWWLRRGRLTRVAAAPRRGTSG